MTGYWDIHNHMLPGIDDGSASMEETVQLVKLSYDQGVRHLIFTPHYRQDMSGITLDEKEEVYHRTCKMLSGYFPDMQFYLGCEYYVTPDILTRLCQDFRYRMPGGYSALIEFSCAAEFAVLRRTVERLRQENIIPVIAHFERYQCLREEPERLRHLKSEGALLQMNCDGILGHEGFRMKRFCTSSLKQGYVDFIGTDAHGTDYRSVHLAAAAAFIRKRMGESCVKKLLRQNPERLFGKSSVKTGGREEKRVNANEKAGTLEGRHFIIDDI